ncbi:hypothetical protein [Noviherbaspirillum saxi]|uniref:Uncharacterized protein n=1 Tax=Noviherbaspirillum saxi TaxID=2320863 RepID=A0A3A3FHK4_9BURK|nr:hypothetical protein [Noviherbaspirillum saxi]RJF92640.1 hypothetical protein D3871_29095 [Noviherbaspirillum saxi]
MTTATVATYPASGVAGNYADNLGRAARRLIAALLGAQPRIVAAAPKTAAVSASASGVNLMKLYRLSGSTDSVRPAVLAELRAIASQHD